MMNFFKKHITLFSDLGLIYAAAIWGSTFFIVKNTLEMVDPVTLVAYRFLISALIMLAILIVSRKNIFQGIKEGLVLGILMWLLYLPQTVGLKYTSASNSGFITGLFILFLPIFSFLFFKALPSLMKIISVTIALLGLYLLTGGLKKMNFGDMLTLLAALTYALHILAADKYVKTKIDPYAMCFHQFLVTGVLSLCTAIIIKASLANPGFVPLSTIMFLAIFPGVSAFMIQLLAQKHTSPMKVGLIFSLEPVFAALFAWTLGKEKFIVTSAIGGMLIVAAMIIADLNFKKRTKNEKP